MRYIIDCQTKGKGTLIRRLARLKTTIAVSDGGVYREDTTLSQVHLESSLSESDVDYWLWKNNFEYVGVVDAFKA